MARYHAARAVWRAWASTGGAPSGGRSRPVDCAATAGPGDFVGRGVGILRDLVFAPTERPFPASGGPTHGRGHGLGMDRNTTLSGPSPVYRGHHVHRRPCSLCRRGVGPLRRSVGRGPGLGESTRISQPPRARLAGGRSDEFHIRFGSAPAQPGLSGLSLPVPCYAGKRVSAADRLRPPDHRAGRFQPQSSPTGLHAHTAGRESRGPRHQLRSHAGPFGRRPTGCRRK